jgi:hypothetical protein
MSDISLWSITYEVNGVLYTTRMDYDHSWLCDIDMDDLVPLEVEQ